MKRIAIALAVSLAVSGAALAQEKTIKIAGFGAVIGYIAICFQQFRNHDVEFRDQGFKSISLGGETRNIFALGHPHLSLVIPSRVNAIRFTFQARAGRSPMLRCCDFRHNLLWLHWSHRNNR